MLFSQLNDSKIKVNVCLSVLNDKRVQVEKISTFDVKEI